MMEDQEIIREIKCIRSEFVDVLEELCKNQKIDPIGLIAKDARKAIDLMDEIVKALRSNISEKEGI